MHLLDLACRLVLAAIFLVAAAGKLGTAGSTASLMETHRLPPQLRPFAAILPLAETAVAAGLFVAQSTRAAGLAALGLLGVFSLVLVRTKRRGAATGCNCFGSLVSASGSRPLARNLLLALVAVPPVAGAAAGGLGLLSAFLGSAGLFGLVGLLVLAMAGRRRLELPQLGATSPSLASPGGLEAEMAASTLDGQSVSLRHLEEEGEAGGTVIVFVDPHCGPCATVVPTLVERWQSLPPGRVLVATDAEAAIARSFLEGLPEQSVLLDRDSALARAYGVFGTPSAVRLSPRGETVEERATGATEIALLLRRLAAGAAALPAEGPLSRALSRRDVLSAAGVSTGLAFAATACSGGAGSAGSTGAQAKSLTCPSCGSCVVCEPAVDSSGRATLHCRACRQSCSAHKLCANFATKLPAHQRIATYLLGAGFVPSGEPWALGWSDAGKLAWFGNLSSFDNTATGERAALVYNLTSSGESAYGLLVDPDKAVSAVLGVPASNEVVRVEVPPKQTPSGSPPPSSVVLEAAGCTDRCQLAASFMLFALALPLLAADPIPAALAMVSFLLGNLQPGTTLGAWGSLISSVINAADMYNIVALAEDKATEQFCALVCHKEGLLKLRACCNYSGACFHSDALCEKNCPGGLAHPLAHCDVYVNGKKVSHLIP